MTDRHLGVSAVCAEFQQCLSGRPAPVLAARLQTLTAFLVAVVGLRLVVLDMAVA